MNAWLFKRVMAVEFMLFLALGVCDSVSVAGGRSLDFGSKVAFLAKALLVWGGLQIII